MNTNWHPQVKYILLLLLSGLTLSVISLTVYNWHLERNLENPYLEPALDYGRQLNPDALKRALASAGYDDESDSASHLLLYFFRPSHFDHLKTVKYGQVLEKRHMERGLRVFVVSDASPNEMAALLKKEAFSLSFLYDKDSLLRMLLRVPESYEHTFLISPTGRVIFSVEGAPQEDLIRQIVEKYVVGKIQYNHIKVTDFYRVGGPQPAIRALSLRNEQVVELSPRNTEIVLISARCTACQLDRVISRLAELASSYSKDATRYYVFSSRFPKQLVVDELKEKGVSLENFYLALEPLGSLDNEYETKESDESAVVVGVDQDGRIHSVKPLE